MLAQQVDGTRVEARGLEPEDRDLGLPGRRRGEQVVDVDAPLEHHDARVLAEGGERRRLPRRPGGDDEHDDHQPTLTTVTVGDSSPARSSK